jgi:hypothetical protein
MDIDVTSTGKNNQTLGLKHWLFQVIPPSLMLCVLLATTSGTSLVFLVGFFILPVLISLISIIVKLIFYKKRKHYLIRPILTIAIFILLFIIADWSYKIALDHSITEARIIHQQCSENLSCPENPVGWQVNGSRVKKNDLGFWLKYTASYYYNKESFNIRFYRGPDMGDIITGGVNLPFKVDPYVE